VYIFVGFPYVFFFIFPWQTSFAVKLKSSGENATFQLHLNNSICIKFNASRRNCQWNGGKMWEAGRKKGGVCAPVSQDIEWRVKILPNYSRFDFFLFGYNFGNNFAQSFAIRHSQISFELKYIFVSMCFCVPMGIKSQHLKFIGLEIKILFPTECHIRYQNMSSNIF